MKNRKPSARNSAGAAKKRRPAPTDHADDPRTSEVESERILQAILDTAVEAIITIDDHGIIQSANAATEAMFGYSARELIGRNVSMLMPSPDRERHDGYIKRHQQTGKARIIGIGRELTARRRNGTLFPVDLSVSEVHLPTRHIYAGFLRDITERKEAEARLRNSEQRLRLMVENLPAGAVYVERHAILYNKAAIEITGYPNGEITSVQGWFKRLFPHRARQALADYRRDRRTGFPRPRVVPLTRKDGKRRIVEMSGYAYEQGEVWLLHDVTKREQAERIFQTEFAATQLFTQTPERTALTLELLRVICEGLDWDMGELWMPIPATKQLRREFVWRMPRFTGTAFNRVSGQASLPYGRDLPGQVWATGRPAWIRKLHAGRPSRLRAAAARAGLRTAFGFPIKVDSAIHGVMVFYTRQNRDPEPDLLTAMADLGIRIGSYVKRREAEVALRESEARLQAIFDNAPTFFFLKDPAGRYLMVNPFFEALCGRVARDIQGHSDRDLFPSESARIFRQNDQEAITLRKAVKFEIALPHPNGLRHYLATTFPLLNEAKEIYALCGIGADMTELRQLEHEILNVSDSEQQRIGQDLHDGLCQHLAGIEFISEALEQRLASRHMEEAGTAGQIASLMREAIAHTRDLSKGLSPVILEPDGLMSSLGLMADNIRKYFKIECGFHCAKPVLVHDNNVATHLFRIAQEAVNNAIRHGQASAIRIHMTSTVGRLILAIHDDGRGIPISRPKGKGLGLRIMQYRSGMIGGSIVIQPEPGGGTSVVCSVHQERLNPSHTPESTHATSEKKRRRP